MARRHWIGGMVIFLVCLCQGAGADKLKTFEADATKPQDHRAQSRHDHHEHRHSGGHVLDGDDDDWGNLGFQIICEGLSVGLVQSLNYVNPDIPPLRKAGDPLIPCLRIEGAWQDVTGDVEAADLYAQGGYGPLAVDFRRTHYTESPHSHLDLQWCHLLARMTYSEHVELDLGVGGFWMDGSTHTTGTSLTSALLIYPNEQWGLEFRPTIAHLETKSTIRDFDLALHIRPGVAGIKLGYRWVESPNMSLDGPYAGLAFRW